MSNREEFALLCKIKGLVMKLRERKLAKREQTDLACLEDKLNDLNN